MAFETVQEAEKKVLVTLGQFQVTVPLALARILEISNVGLPKAVLEGCEVRGQDKASLEGSLGDYIANSLDAEIRMKGVRRHHGWHIVHWTRIIGRLKIKLQGGSEKVAQIETGA